MEGVQEGKRYNPEYRIVRPSGKVRCVHSRRNMSRPIRILYVDNYPFDREFVRDALEKEDGGFQVVEAASRAEFEARMAEGDFDLVLSDFNIPGFEGLQVIDAVCAKNIHLPIVIITGSGSEEIAVQALKLGAADYITKTPHSIRNLPVALRAVLARVRTEARFEGLLEFAPDAIVILDKDGEIHLVNAQTEKIFGYSREELIGQPVERLLPERFRGRHATHREYYFLNPKVRAMGVGFDLYGLHKDGREFPVDISLSPLYTSEGTLAAATIRDITERKELQKSYRLLVENSLQGISVIQDGCFVFVNRALGNILGRSVEELLALSPEEVGNLVHSEDRARVLGYMRDWAAGKPTPTSYEARGIRKDGSLCWLQAMFATIEYQGKLALQATVIDITERKRAENLLAGQNQILEMITTGASLENALTYLVHLVESQTEGMLASILLLDQAGLHLRHGAAPNLPAAYIKRLNGIPIGPQVGSCGTAAYRGEPIIVTDILTDPLWSDYRHLAAPFGLRACWATPIFSPRGNVVGSFAMYYREVRSPNQAELQLIGIATHVASIAIEHKRAAEALRESEERYRAVTQFANDAIISANEQGYMISWNEGAKELFGYTEEETLGQPLTMLMPDEYQAAYHKGLNLFLTTGELHALGKTTERVGKRKDGSVFPVELSLATWKTTEGIFFTGILRDITERKQAEKAIQRHLKEMETLYESGLAVSRLLEPKAIARAVIDIIRQKLAWHHAAVRLYDAETDTIKVLALDRQGMTVEETEAEIERLNQAIARSGQGLSGWVIQHGEAVISGNVQADQRYFGTFPNIQSGIYVPIRVGERVLGVITAESLEKDAFTEHDKQLLTTLANQVAAAIQNAQLFAETRQRLRELEAVSRISTALRTAQTLDEMLPVLLDETLAALDSEAGVIWLYHREAGELRVAVARGWMEQLKDAVMKPGQGIAGTVFSSGQLHISREFVSDPLTLTALARVIPGGWGGICVPVRAASEVVGVQFLAVPLPREITPEESKLLASLAEIAGNALHRLSLHEETVRRLNQLQALQLVDQVITASFDLRVSLNVLLEQTIAQLGVDAADVLLLAPHTQVLEYAAGMGFRSRVSERVWVRLGQGYAGRAALERRTLRVANLTEATDVFPRAGLLADEGFVTFFTTPLIAKGQVLGVLEVFQRKLLQPNEEWVNFLETLAAQAAIAIDSVKSFENLQRSNTDLALAYDTTIEGWSRALDLRDKETEGHTLRVTEMTLRLGRSAGMTPEELVHVRRGALLHDIGKMGVPDAILLKPGQLTEEEWEIMKKHPQYAFELLSPISYLRPALDIPYCHHEKWDGTGYPRGLKGEQIPLSARLFAVVDVWDALRSDRPYRPGWSDEKVIERICAEAGKHFDPIAVELFLHTLKEKAFL